MPLTAARIGDRVLGDRARRDDRGAGAPQRARRRAPWPARASGTWWWPGTPTSTSPISRPPRSTRPSTTRAAPRSTGRPADLPHRRARRPRGPARTRVRRSRPPTPSTPHAACARRAGLSARAHRPAGSCASRAPRGDWAGRVLLARRRGRPRPPARPRLRVGAAPFRRRLAHRRRRPRPAHPVADRRRPAAGAGHPGVARAAGADLPGLVGGAAGRRQPAPTASLSRPPATGLPRALCRSRRPASLRLAGCALVRACLPCAALPGRGARTGSRPGREPAGDRDRDVAATACWWTGARGPCGSRERPRDREAPGLRGPGGARARIRYGNLNGPHSPRP